MYDVESSGRTEGKPKNKVSEKRRVSLNAMNKTENKLGRNINFYPLPKLGFISPFSPVHYIT